MNYSGKVLVLAFIQCYNTTYVSTVLMGTGGHVVWVVEPGWTWQRPSHRVRIRWLRFRISGSHWLASPWNSPKWNVLSFERPPTIKLTIICAVYSAIILTGAKLQSLNNLSYRSDLSHFMDTGVIELHMTQCAQRQHDNCVDGYQVGRDGGKRRVTELWSQNM